MDVCVGYGYDRVGLGLGKGAFIIVITCYRGNRLFFL